MIISKFYCLHVQSHASSAYDIFKELQNFVSILPQLKFSIASKCQHFFRKLAINFALEGSPCGERLTPISVHMCESYIPRFESLDTHNWAAMLNVNAVCLMISIDTTFDI